MECAHGWQVAKECEAAEELARKERELKAQVEAELEVLKEEKQGLVDDCVDELSREAAELQLAEVLCAVCGVDEACAVLCRVLCFAVDAQC